MKKLLFLLPIFLFGGVLDFRPCLIKYSYIKNSIPISKTKSITFGNKNCIKFDPFTKMCLINSHNKKIVKFFNKPELGWWMASIKNSEIYIGNFAKEGFLLNPSLLSVKTIKNSLVSDLFCRAIGIGDGVGFYKEDLIKHFIKYGYWGDVGIDVNEKLEIISFDPFYVKGIKLKDKIQKINYKKATPKLFKEYILLFKKGKNVVLTINNKDYKLKIRKKDYFFTPLEYFGIKLDENLTLLAIPKKFQTVYFIKPGAKLIKVNQKRVYSLNDVREALSTYKNVTITIKYKELVAQVPIR